MNYLIIILLIFIFLLAGFRIIFFIISPIIKKSKLVKTYNNLFFIREKRKCIEIHLGFAKDVIFYRNFSRRKLLIHLADGLLKLISEIEAGKISLNRIIQGNPYFFKSNNFKNFGFNERELNFYEKVRFYLNYFELSFLKSLKSKKILFVKADKLKIVYTTGKTLLENKNNIISTYLRLNNFDSTKLKDGLHGFDSLPFSKTAV